MQNKMNSPSDYEKRSSFGIQAKIQFQREYSTLFGMNPDVCDGILQMHGLLNQYLVICVMNHYYSLFNEETNQITDYTQLREWSDMYLSNCSAKFVDNWAKALQSNGISERQIFSFLNCFGNMGGDKFLNLNRLLVKENSWDLVPDMMRLLSKLKQLYRNPDIKFDDLVLTSLDTTELLRPRVKEFATILMAADDSTFHTLSSQLLEDLYRQNYSVADICNILKLKQEVNDDALLSFFQGHPQVIPLMMSLKSNRTLVWNWIKNHESLLSESFEEVCSFLSDSSPQTVQMIRVTVDTPLSLSQFQRLRTMADLDCPEKLSMILKHAPIAMESANCQEVIERAVIEKDCVLVDSMRVDHLEGYSGELQTVSGRWKDGKSEGWQRVVYKDRTVEECFFSQGVRQGWAWRSRDVDFFMSNYDALNTWYKAHQQGGLPRVYHIADDAQDVVFKFCNGYKRICRNGEQLGFSAIMQEEFPMSREMLVLLDPKLSGSLFRPFRTPQMRIVDDVFDPIPGIAGVELVSSQEDMNRLLQAATRYFSATGKLILHNMKYSGKIEVNCDMENLNTLCIEGCMCSELAVNSLTGMVKLVVSNCPKLLQIFIEAGTCPYLTEIQFTDIPSLRYVEIQGTYRNCKLTMHNVSNRVNTEFVDDSVTVL